MTQLWTLNSKSFHPLHRICSYMGSFPPQLPAFFLDKYPEAKTVLDPFAGRGTTVLEAVLRGKKVYGVDVSPLARLLSSVKVTCPTMVDVVQEIYSLNLNGDGDVPPPPEDVAPFYDEATWRQVWRLREAKRSDALTALALGKLHGHSSGFFSCTTFNVVSIHGAALTKLKDKHRGVVKEKGKVTFVEGTRNVTGLLRTAAKKFLPNEPVQGDGQILAADARNIPLPDGSIDIIITSPPFLDVIDYADVNWLRLWFLGHDYQRVPTTFFRSMADYKTFLRDVLRELARLLSPTGHIVFEVGPVKRETKLSDLVVEAAQGILDVEETLVHSFATDENGEVGASVSKISRAMQKDAGKLTTTMENQCVVLRRLS
jgi:SAM-dependent methyltransferase